MIHHINSMQTLKFAEFTDTELLKTLKNGSLKQDFIKETLLGNEYSPGFSLDDEQKGILKELLDSNNLLTKSFEEVFFSLKPNEIQKKQFQTNNYQIQPLYSLKIEITNPSSATEILTEIFEKLQEQNLSQHIKELDLSSNHLTYLPENFPDFNGLKCLNLSYNQLTHIPENQFHSLSQVNEINLSHNLFSTFSEKTFWYTPELKTLNLANNQLDHLPEKIFYVHQNLEHLSLSHNQLTNLPHGIFNALCKLNMLKLAHNTFQLNASLFEKLESLAFIDFSNNQLEFLPEDLLKNNHQLKELWLNCNKLETLSENLFSFNQSLQSIFLQENFLKSLPENLFISTSNLKILDLSANAFEHFNNKTFTPLLNLKKVNLKDNLIHHIDAELFSSLENLKFIGLNFSQI